jgi:UDP-N-acetylglucosamine--N-acetylmuramyl-(pentapeptide) pyrophosphoryl-undecaprenol N-acetylglucosamine transferase
VAVFRALRDAHPRDELRFWCDFGFYKQARATVDTFDPNLQIDRIVAGKLRRYHHLTLLQQLTWPSLVLKNLRDVFLVGIGVIQSIIKLIAWRPDVVFTKGGFVCLPVGFAAHLLRIPLVIHDSDAHPGLTNRILARWATSIATGAPLEHYPYPASKSHYIGIPVNEKFVPLSTKEQAAAKEEWGVDSTQPLIVVTGGGLGAMRINDLVVDNISKLRKLGSIILVSGTAQYEELKAELPDDDPRFQLKAFVTNMSSLLGAADVVVARAGATTILELAALKKPTILIPNAKLTGGHQLKNAAVYAKKEAVIVVDEDHMEERPKILVDAIEELLDNPQWAQEMAARFYTFRRPDAAKEMAKLIVAAGAAR